MAPHNTVRGHLIGLDSLGGQEERFNLVPMYGQFNLSTYKTKFENVLKQKVQVHVVVSAEVELRIEYDDLKRDPRVPVAFNYDLTIKNADDSARKLSDSILHPAPELAYKTAENGVGKYIATIQSRMTKAHWWVEDNVVTGSAPEPLRTWRPAEPAEGL